MMMAKPLIDIRYLDINNLLLADHELQISVQGVAPQLAPWRQLQGPQPRVGGRRGDRPLVPRGAQPRPTAGVAALESEE